MTRFIFWRVLLVAIVIFGLLALSGVLFAQGQSEEGLERAKQAQEAHTPELMAINGVVGTAVGLEGERPVVLVLLERGGVQGIPDSVGGVPVKVMVTGKIYALADPTARFDRPVPIGVSCGHPAITAGTIGCRVTDGSNVYVLSNNHVLANENEAQLGDSALQPGPYDGGSDYADKIGTLHDFEPIKFRGNARNTIDAAIAKSSESLLGTATLSDGYGVPNSTTVEPALDMAVQKYGRTTELTHGTIDGINTTVRVGYSRGSAIFVDQILIGPGTFSDSGDSGSLIVTDNSSCNPVGLLFAGSDTITVANPIDAVLSRFNVTIDDSSTPSDSPPSVSITNPADEATVLDTVIVSADATDDVGVVQVDFYIDGLWRATDTVAPYSYSWDTTTVSDGSHTIEAVATDTIGQKASDIVSVTVDNIDDPPIVWITNPSDGDVVSGLVTVTADASDDDGVDLVEFFVDDGTIGTDTSAPFEISWDSTIVGDGSHTIKAVATDTIGQTASDSVNVTVSNDGGGEMMHVSAIDMWYSSAGPNYFINTCVTIVDDTSTPVSDATVYLTTTLPDDSTTSGSGLTGSDGTVTFKSKSRQTGTYTSAVTNVTHASLSYNSGANVETGETLPVP